MTDPAPDVSVVSPEEPSEEKGGLRGVIYAIANRIDNKEHPRRFSTGEMAELRRLSPNDLTASVFWQIVAEHLNPDKLLAARSPRREEQESAWATILSGMAHMKGLHRAKRNPGHALRDARFSELRLTRLLRARGDALFDNMRGVAHYLASKGEAVDWTDLAKLVLYQEDPSAEDVRRRIARDFYAQSPNPSQE